MGWIRQDLRFAWRSLRTQPGFTLMAIATLALGIGATTAIFSIVHGILLRPLPYAESDRIVGVWQMDKSGEVPDDGGQLSHPNYLDIRSQLRSFEAIAQVNRSNLVVTSAGSAELVKGAIVTPGFFRVFHALPVQGREFTDEEDRPMGPKVAIVSDRYWREQLGAKRDVIGSTIRIASAPYQIVGVAPDGFDYPDGARIWTPIQNDDEGCGRGCVLRQAVARLRPGASLERARADLTALAGQLESQYPDTNPNTTFSAASLHDITVGSVRDALRVLLGAVALVLLIACANVANLLLVRGRARQTEIAVRTTLGASRRRILVQLLTESLILAIVGGVAGMILAAWGVDILRSVAPSDIPRLDEITVDPTTLAFAAALVAATALLFGLAPALQLSRVSLGDSLRVGGRGDVSSGRTGRGRATILAVEVALSVMLLLASGLLLRSLVERNNVAFGFDPRGIVQFRLNLTEARYPQPDDAARFMEQLRERLSSVPGVADVAIMVAPPLSYVDMNSDFERTDRPKPRPDEGLNIIYRIVDDKALDMLRIPIVAGRGFLASDRRGAPPVAMISKLAAERYYPGEDPVGKLIDVSISAGYSEDTPRTIVGVVGDIRGVQLTREPHPELYVPYAQSGASFPHVLLRASAEPGQVLNAVRQAVQSLDPELPLIEPATMDRFVGRELARPRFYVMLIGLFAFLAVLLAAVGMYGVVAYAVAQRTREIGLRMALGARLLQVVRLVLWQGLRPALFGIAVGLVGAMAGGRALAGLLFGVEPQDPLTFVAVPIVLTAIVLLACALPARRASRIPPAIALRAE